MKPSLFCAQYFPPRKVKHLSLHGIPVHIRTDCPPDTLFMISEPKLQIKPNMKKTKKVNKLKLAKTAVAKKILKAKKK